MPASYTIGTGSSCANTTVIENYYEGIALNASNIVTLDATVTTLGTWSITTNTVNGYSFSGSGIFATTGTVQVTLDGTGTPITAQTDNFTATANGSGGACTYSVTVITLEVYNPATGRTWMDRNLGASQVATSSTDAAAYGDLYQWGRATEGHEDRSSGFTFYNATTPVPGASHLWNGLFIGEDNSPNDWLTPQDSTLWQGQGGTNNPCPTGFRLPTEVEWEAERQSWVSNDAAGAFDSPLKLTVGGLRSFGSGSIQSTGSLGYYWSSSVSNTGTRRLYISSGASFSTSYRAMGFSVRCIKD